MKLRMAITTFAVALATSWIPVAAHHSRTETFDVGREISIRGVVTRLEWVNPHARFWVDERNDDGNRLTWELELPPPNALGRTYGKDFLKPGDQVTVVLWRSKTGSALGSVLELALPEGRVLHFSRDTMNDWVPTAR